MKREPDQVVIECEVRDVGIVRQILAAWFREGDLPERFAFSRDLRPGYIVLQARDGAIAAQFCTPLHETETLIAIALALGDALQSRSSDPQLLKEVRRAL